jgi:putative Ca2+/H+ antiporter (TMEM165/GDT1 family)
MHSEPTSTRLVVLSATVAVLFLVELLDRTQLPADLIAPQLFTRFFEEHFMLLF